MLEGDEVDHCFVCGAALAGEKAPSAIKSLEMMLVAEDSMVFREVLKDKIMEMGLARKVEVTDNGEQFVCALTRILAGSGTVSLAILDIRMPIMSGINAALAMRAVEKGLSRKRPVPILFFSSMRCDDTLRNVLKHCAPARYINKGASASPDGLADRLVEVIRRLLEESSGKK